MSKWLDKLIHKIESHEIENHKSEEDFRYALEERAAIIQFDGEESECEYKALLDFANEEIDSLKKHVQIINGESYLRLEADT